MTRTPTRTVPVPPNPIDPQTTKCTNEPDKKKNLFDLIYVQSHAIKLLPSSVILQYHSTV